MNATLPSGVAGSAYQADLLLTGTAPFSLASFTGALASAGLSGSVVESPASSGTYYLRVSGVLPASAQQLGRNRLDITVTLTGAAITRCLYLARLLATIGAEPTALMPKLRFVLNDSWNIAAFPGLVRDQARR
ncbi:MAG: hypothetical protein R3E87_07450 [Burkholderiaceae bacterium]